MAPLLPAIFIDEWIGGTSGMHSGQWIIALGLPWAAYLMGSIPFGLVIVRVMGRGDIRESGSGNIGATNVRRAVGIFPAVATLLGDIAKGFLPVWWAGSLAATEPSLWFQAYVALVGVCALAGHLYPVFLKFRTGGKGEASSWADS